MLLFISAVALMCNTYSLYTPRSQSTVCLVLSFGGHAYSRSPGISLSVHRVLYFQRFLLWTDHPLIAFLSVVFPLLCRFVVTHTNSLDSILLWLFWIASLCIAETPSVWWCCIQQISSYIICKDLGPSNSNPRHENYMTIYWTSKNDYEVCDVASNLCGDTLCLFDFNVWTYLRMWRYARCTATRMRPDILRSLLWVTILEKPLL